MKKVTVAAIAAMVLVTGAMAEDVSVNNYVKNGTFDTKGYFKALNKEKNKDRVSEDELLLRLVMMKEALKDAQALDEVSDMDTYVARSACGGVAQRLNSEYGSYENMNMSQQEIKAGVVNMRQSWGHLCWAAALQYRFDGWREYNFEKAMWGQAYSMAAAEKITENKIKERILEGEHLDPNYIKNRPLYSSLKILRPLRDPQSNLKQKIILGYTVNDISSVEENLFENVVSSAMINHEPWRISQFLNNPREFIADMKKKPAVTKYYNYMSTQMKDPGLLLDKIRESFESAAIAQAKVEEEKRIAQVKAEQEIVEAQRIAEQKAEEEYQKNLPQLKSELLDMRKKAKILNCQGHGQTTFVDSDIAYCKKVGLCYRRIDIRGNTYVFPFQLEKSLFGEYRAKIYKGKGVLLSQCRTKEEDEGRFNIVFPQEIVNLPYPKINSATSEYSKTQQYKIASDKWELDHPRWGEYNLSPRDIEFAEQQIVNELKANE